MTTTTTNEIWRTIEKHPKYEVSNMGNVRNKKDQYILTPCKNYRGYYRVMLNGVWKTIHRLVAETFIPNPDNLDTIDHINGDIYNNTIENLQWMCRGDNVRKSSLGSKRTVRNEKVACLETGKVYNSGAEAARQLGVYSQSVLGCCKGKQNSAINKISGQRFHFMYVTDYYEYLAAQLLEETFLNDEVETDGSEMVSVCGVPLNEYLDEVSVNA